MRESSITLDGQKAAATPPRPFSAEKVSLFDIIVSTFDGEFYEEGSYSDRLVKACFRVYGHRQSYQGIRGEEVPWQGADEHRRELRSNDRAECKRYFDASFEARDDDYDILLATDKLSEGFNLNRAGLVVNYDIPWNPTRVIQRVGRISRIGK